jgi:FkbM family methyltransferase
VTPEARHIARRALPAVRAVPTPRSSDARTRPSLLGLNEIGSLSTHRIEAASRASANPTYLGDGLALCGMLTRYKFYLDPGDRTFAPHLLLDGYWESGLTRFIARNVQPGWTVADVGAHCGYYSILMADLVGPEGRVVAVEPHPGAVSLLRRSTMLNGFGERIRISESAAAALDGRATLYAPAASAGGSSLVGRFGEPGPECERIDVATVRLDSLLAEEKRVDFIKVDAEGSEEAIVGGMEQILARHRPALALEYNAAWYDDPGGFLGRLQLLYGTIRRIDMNGNAVAVAAGTLLSGKVEHMLYIAQS